MITSSILTNIGKQIATGVVIGVGVEVATIALKNMGRAGKAAQSAYERMEERARIIRNERKLREREKLLRRLHELDETGEVA